MHLLKIRSNPDFFFFFQIQKNKYICLCYERPELSLCSATSLLFNLSWTHLPYSCPVILERYWENKIPEKKIYWVNSCHITSIFLLDTRRLPQNRFLCIYVVGSLNGSQHYTDTYFSDARKSQGITAVEMSTSPVELCSVRVSRIEVTQLVTEIKQKGYHKQCVLHERVT